MDERTEVSCPPPSLDEALENCPFCGSTAHYFFDRRLSPAKNEREWAICDGCEAAEPVSVWQRRAAANDGA